jgi:hypothetical protein
MMAEIRRDQGPGQTNTRAFIFGLSLRDALLVTILAALAIGAKQLLRLPLKLPGHGFTLTAFLGLLAIGRVARPGAGTLFGVLSGLLALLLGLGKGGLLEPLRWIIPFASLDLLLMMGVSPVAGLGRAIFVGAVAGLLRAGTGAAVDLLVGLPLDWILANLAIKASTHLAFGALGASLALPILHRLEHRL